MKHLIVFSILLTACESPVFRTEPNKNGAATTSTDANANANTGTNQTTGTNANNGTGTSTNSNVNDTSIANGTSTGVYTTNPDGSIATESLNSTNTGGSLGSNTEFNNGGTTGGSGSGSSAFTSPAGPLAFDCTNTNDIERVTGPEQRDSKGQSFGNLTWEQCKAPAIISGSATQALYRNGANNFKCCRPIGGNPVRTNEKTQVFSIGNNDFATKVSDFYCPTEAPFLVGILGAGANGVNQDLIQLNITAASINTPVYDNMRCSGLMVGGRHAEPDRSQLSKMAFQIISPNYPKIARAYNDCGANRVAVGFRYQPGDFDSNYAAPQFLLCAPVLLK